MNVDRELIESIESLSKAIGEKKKKAVGTTKLYAIVYALLIVFVVCYTTVIFVKIKEYATPDAVSAMIMNKVKDSLPDLNKAIVDHSRKAAPMIADKAVESVNEAIPKAEEMVKDVIRQYTRQIVVQMKADIFPKFIKILKDNSKQISQSADALTDENTAKELAKTLADEIRREIDNNVICYEFFQKLKEVTGELERIASKPANELTAKEAAERRMIVNWLYLVKKGDTFKGLMNTSMRKFVFFWEDLVNGILPEHVKKDLEAINTGK